MSACSGNKRKYCLKLQRPGTSAGKGCDLKLDLVLVTKAHGSKSHMRARMDASVCVCVCCLCVGLPSGMRRGGVEVGLQGSLYLHNKVCLCCTLDSAMLLWVYFRFVSHGALVCVLLIQLMFAVFA